MKKFSVCPFNYTDQGLNQFMEEAINEKKVYYQLMTKILLIIFKILEKNFLT